MSRRYPDPVQIWLSTEQHEQLKAASAATRLPMSEIVREALAAYLRGAQPLAAWLEREEDTKEQHP